jgi:hypothetical protein
MKNYRITKKESEIKGIISQSIKHSNNIAWQTSGEFRQVFDVIEMKKDVQLNLLILKLDVGFGSIDKNREIYIKLAHENSVFKAKCLKVDFDRVTVIAPSELHTKENRIAPRKKFKSYDEASMQIAMSVYDDFSSPHILKVKLLDISTDGFAAQVSKTNLDFIRSCVHFNLLEVNGHKLHKPVPIKFSYVTAVIKNTGARQRIINRIGYSFLKPFTKDQLRMYF